VELISKEECIVKFVAELERELKMFEVRV